MTVKSNSEKLGQGVGFERIRRITGYLVGTMDKWNDAKRAEVPLTITAQDSRVQERKMTAQESMRRSDLHK